MTEYSFDAVIFDLDGVITQTALVHSEAWKLMFNEYLKEREQKHGEPFEAFTHQRDYLLYVDGKPRYKGVASFLESRGIDIPFGDPSDVPELETACALGNRKDLAFRRILETEGVKEYPSTVSLIRELLDTGIRVGVASSSKNCRVVLEAAGLLSLFETRVDGEVSAELGLSGKPRPDIFTVAADNLKVSYDRTIVVEDAVSGVQAGRAGNFGLVLGIAREDNARELRQNGADWVVSDLGEITLDDLEQWFRKGMKDDSWTLSWSGYDPAMEGVREALLTVGNGYLGTRGAADESRADGCHYPGTYVAGVYNRLTSSVSGRQIENEDFVAIPNWQHLTFRIEKDDWMDVDQATFHRYDRCLDFRTGLYRRSYEVEDSAGRRTEVVAERVASMANPHLVATRYSVCPLNYSGQITFRSLLDGNIENGNVARYRQLTSKHLVPVSQAADGATGHLLVETSQSKIRIAQAVQIVLCRDGDVVSGVFDCEVETGTVGHQCSVTAREGEAVTLEKIVAITSSRDNNEEEPLQRALAMVASNVRFAQLLDDSAAAWKPLWDEADVQLEGDRLAQKLLRLHIFHTLVTASMHNTDMDVGIPARGLHGEAYRGHVFWDELFVLPFFHIHFPDISAALLRYRYRRLDMARQLAAQHGFKGAMFPWQSGSDGREETQIIHLNPLTGIWGDDHSSLQRHVSLAIALNIWQYFQVTGDMSFMRECGAEMMLSIGQCFASMAQYSESDGRYGISRVMGPDEYHEQYPGSEGGGLSDNSYTNIMVVWLLDRCAAVMGLLSDGDRSVILARADVEAAEMKRWADITQKMRLCLQDGVLAQFDGYFDLEELPWETYREKYGDIHRMDRILKAEGLSPDSFKVAKQADVLMAFFNLPHEEVTGILSRLGYPQEAGCLRRNYDYYIQRTSHGSTLSRIVHADLANRMGDRDQSFELYDEALRSDYADVQGGTTAEGIHAGVMTSTVMAALRSFSGVDVFDGVLRVCPRLPKRWRRTAFRLRFRGDWLSFEITRDQVTVTPLQLREPLPVIVNGTSHTMKPGQSLTLQHG